MARITDPEAAMRFARAILADIALYNDDAIKNAARSDGGGVAEAVEEGRQLFAQRVEPHLLATFDTALAGSRLAPWGSVIGGAPPPVERRRVAGQPLMTTEEAPSKLPFVVLVLVLVVAALVLVLVRR